MTLVSTRTYGDQSGNGAGEDPHALMLAVPRSFPAPRQLATPTDLSAEAVAAVTAAVNLLIADTFALYVKTKNFHWHVAGSHFRDYHLLLDEQADAILDSVDGLAERVRRIGGMTIRASGTSQTVQTVGSAARLPGPDPGSAEEDGVADDMATASIG